MRSRGLRINGSLIAVLVALLAMAVVIDPAIAAGRITVQSAVFRAIDNIDNPGADVKDVVANICNDRHECDFVGDDHTLKQEGFLPNIHHKVVEVKWTCSDDQAPHEKVPPVLSGLHVYLFCD
jgi:hypothetical protein